MSQALALFLSKGLSISRGIGLTPEGILELPHLAFHVHILGGRPLLGQPVWLLHRLLVSQAAWPIGRDGARCIRG